MPEVLDRWSAGDARWPDWLRARWETAAGGADADRLGWVRQGLRWADLHAGQERVATTPVPGRIARDAALLERFGLERSGSGLVAARPWRPTWLAGTVAHDADAAHAAVARRPKAAVGGDPFLSAVGYTTYLSAGQRAAMRAVLLAPPGSSLLAVLPTGAGKSLLAKLPPLVEDGLTVVVVPTVALALDQERALRQEAEGPNWGPGPFAYVGGRGPIADGRRSAIRDRIRDGSQRIVFASPEAIVGGLSGPLRKAAESGDLRRLVIDEAHMVDAWGEDFRPSFQMVAGFRRALREVQPEIKTVLLSATVTEATRTTLTALFGDGKALAMVSGAQLRPEPSYWAARAPSAAAQNAWVLEAVHHLPRPLVLYTSRPRDAEVWGERLRDSGFERVGTLTGSSRDDERERLVAAWAAGEIDMVTGTSAFGMGIDQSHVRSIVHATLPESLDRYYQEVGRAGRDGGASVALMVTAPGDQRLAEDLAKRTYLKPETGHARWERLFSTRSHEKPDEAGVAADRAVSVNVGVGRTSMMHGRTNAYWNYRTLTMMERAGLVSLRGPAPYDDAQSGTYEVVVLTDTRHRDASFWEARMKSVRRAGLEGGRAGLRAMSSLFNTQRCWAMEFQVYYALAGHPAPTPSCGGCPVCRGAGKEPYALTGAEPALPWHLTPKDLAKTSVPAVLATAGVLGVEVPAGGGVQARARLVRLLRALAANGFRMVVGDAGEVDVGRDVQPGLPSLLTAATVTPFLPDLPTVVLCLGGPVPASAYAGGRPQPRVVVFDEGAPDPSRPHRLLRDRIETRRLDHLLFDLSA